MSLKVIGIQTPKLWIDLTKREMGRGLIILGIALALGLPLGGKFIRDAMAAGEASQASVASSASQAVTLPRKDSDPASQNRTAVQSRSGSELLSALGLRGKVAYVVYGRPSKNGERTWGSLGASQTAEQSWQVLRNRRSAVRQAIGTGEQDFVLNILNPVYRSQNGVISDAYIQRALELARENRGLVALSFNSLPDATQTVQRLEQLLPKQLLTYLAVSLDVEHFPGGQVAASALNEFSSWFAGKHLAWAGDSPVPGLVLIYSFRGPNDAGQGRIAGLGDLVQYYPPQRTLVAILFDGYGTKQAKLAKIGELIAALPDSPDSPALVGVMEFRTMWGNKYDQASIGETFDTLRGAPTFFLASQ